MSKQKQTRKPKPVADNVEATSMNVETVSDTLPNEAIQPQETPEGLQASAPAQEEATQAPVQQATAEGEVGQVDVWLVHKATSLTSLVVRRESDNLLARCRVRNAAKYRRNVPVSVGGTVATGLYEGKPPVVKRVEVAS